MWSPNWKCELKLRSELMFKSERRWKPIAASKKGQTRVRVPRSRRNTGVMLVSQTFCSARPGRSGPLQRPTCRSQ